MILLRSGVLPQTGVKSVILVSLIAITLLGVFFYRQYGKYKDIK